MHPRAFPLPPFALPNPTNSSPHLQLNHLPSPPTHTPTQQLNQPLNSNQEKREGNFRFLHASVRHHLEAIALYRGLPFEGRRVDEVGSYAICIGLLVYYMCERENVGNTIRISM